jgi:hypothetical protein
MIVSRLIGGLGNQMFQYAAARALADRTDSEVVLDVSGFANYSVHRYGLDAMRVRAKVRSERRADEKESGAVARKVRGLWRRIAPSGFGPAATYRERSFAFDSGVQHQRAPVELEGYWQSEKYFRDDAAAIRADFTPVAEPDAANRAILERMQQTCAVSLHVRRGDYVTNPQAAAFHGSCSPEYYREAVDHIAERAGPLTLFVFSDDQDWVRDNMRFSHTCVHVDCNPPERGVWDMHLMKHCRHHVVANSSFSWWGAWLNPSPEKIVVAPSRWFTDPSIDTSDLIPETWVRI